MKIRALKLFRMEGVIQHISAGEVLDVADHVGAKLIEAGNAEDAFKPAEPVPMAAPEVVETRDPVVENREPVIKRKKTK